MREKTQVRKIAERIVCELPKELGNFHIEDYEGDTVIIKTREHSLVFKSITVAVVTELERDLLVLFVGVRVPYGQDQTITAPRFGYEAYLRDCSIAGRNLRDAIKKSFWLSPYTGV